MPFKNSLLLERPLFLLAVCGRNTAMHRRPYALPQAGALPPKRPCPRAAGLRQAAENADQPDLIKLKHKISKRQTKRLYNMARDRQKSKRFYSFMEVNMQKHQIFGIIAAAIAGCGLLAGAAALGYKLCEEWR